MSPDVETVELQAKCIRETPEAILVEVDGDEHWLPKSCVADHSEVFEEGDDGILVVAEWVAKDRGLA